MREGPRVTVVMPSYNQAPFLAEAIDSVLMQDYPRVELLVMDGGSTDGSLDILRRYGGRLRFVSERDRGQSDAINRGFARATGEVVGWMNSDDRYLTGAISHAVLALSQRPEAAMVYGEGELIDEDGHLLGVFPATQPFDLWKLIHVSDYIMQPTVFMRADCVREIGGLDETLHFAMDWDLWIRLACRWPVVYVPERLAQTREYPATKTATGGYRRLAELRRVMKRHGAPGWPPAAIAYGLDILRRRFPLVFGASSLGDASALARRPSARLFRPLHRLVVQLINRQIVDAQGVWRDGWMAPRAHRAVASDGRPGTLRARFEIPADPALLPMVVELRAGGLSARTSRDQPGPMEVALEIPAGISDSGRAFEVELRASRARRIPGDRRRVSCILQEVTFEPAPCAFDAARPPRASASVSAVDAG